MKYLYIHSVHNTQKNQQQTSYSQKYSKNPISENNQLIFNQIWTLILFPSIYNFLSNSKLFFRNNLWLFEIKMTLINSTEVATAGASYMMKNYWLDSEESKNTEFLKNCDVDDGFSFMIYEALLLTTHEIFFYLNKKCDSGWKMMCTWKKESKRHQNDNFWFLGDFFFNKFSFTKKSLNWNKYQHLI